ncbi:hypothetical protein ACFJIV_07060 [Mucilaginibacter sp. UC70_90]
MALHADLRNNANTLPNGTLHVITFNDGSKRSASTGPLDKPFTISIDNEPLKQSLDKITAACGVRFTYNETVAKSTVKVSLNAKNQPLGDVLRKALALHPF